MVGERILFLEYLKLLKKHKRDADRSRSLWTATTPYLSLAYHRNCGEFCFHVSFPLTPKCIASGIRGALGGQVVSPVIRRLISCATTRLGFPLDIALLQQSGVWGH